MHTAAENLKEILASTLNSLCWWIGHQTYLGVFAWTRGIYIYIYIYIYIHIYTSINEDTVLQEDS